MDGCMNMYLLEGRSGRCQGRCPGDGGTCSPDPGTRWPGKQWRTVNTTGKHSSSVFIQPGLYSHSGWNLNTTHVKSFSKVIQRWPCTSVICCTMCGRMFTSPCRMASSEMVVKIFCASSWSPGLSQMYMPNTDRHTWGSMDICNGVFTLWMCSQQLL